MREWRDTDPESIWWKNAISKIPQLEQAREIRSMPPTASDDIASSFIDLYSP